MLIGIGYTNFSSNSVASKNLGSNTLAVSSTNNIGDVQLVSSSATIVENDNKISENKVLNTVNTVSNTALVDNNDTMQSNSESSNDNYFSDLKMERNQMYSKSIETYQKIIDSKEVAGEQKSIAIQEIQKITDLQNGIQIAEELIKLKGFEDVVIYSSNEKISVTVRVAVLSDSQVAQIQNIVSKELNTEISNITISNK